MRIFIRTIDLRMAAKTESTDSELILVVVVDVLCFPFFVFSVLLSSIHNALCTVPFTPKWINKGS